MTDLTVFLSIFFYGVVLFLVAVLALDAILSLLVAFVRWIGGY